MEIVKTLKNLKRLVEIKPLIIGGMVLALLSADTVLHYSRRESASTTPRQTSGLEVYRGTCEGDNLFKGIPDYVIMEMTRNCPTLSPDRIIDYCNWYKQEYGSWKKWDEATCQAYSEKAWKRHIEANQTPSRV